MSCFFCGSYNHVSAYCDLFDSNEERQKIITSKQCCRNCFASRSFAICGKCGYRKKCYICFSQIHCTIYCPHRFNAPAAPKIDNDLFHRFWKLLNAEDKHFLAFSFPNIFSALKIEPIKVILKKELSLATIFKEYSAYNFVIAEKAFMPNRCFPNPSLELLPSKLPFFYIKHVEIQVSPFNSEEFLLLLSSKTEILSCGKIEFHPKISFREILKKAPKLEDIDISGTNIEISNTWPDDIIKLNTAKDLSLLYLSIPDIYFNVECLATIMKKRFSKHIKINLFINNQNIFFNKQTAFSAVKNHLSKYFTPTKDKSSIRVTYLYQNGWFCSNDSEYYALTL